MAKVSGYARAQQSCRRGSSKYLASTAAHRRFRRKNILGGEGQQTAIDRQRTRFKNTAVLRSNLQRLRISALGG